ncbi:MAG: hypothetical protein WCE62_07435 [Polyangiales bacterium]
MLNFVSCVALGASALGGGCIATDTIEFVPVENFPPSIISQASAEFPLNQIGELNLDEPLLPGEPAAMPLQVSIRDPNFDQTLDYRIFLDAPEPPAAEFPIQDGEIDPTGFLDRPRTFEIAYNDLVPGFCHKIELVVAGKFASTVEQRRPVEPGDFDQVTWWVEVTDSDHPIAERCQ